jgi:nucleotide-binding universal stress UspA family protein
MSFKDLLVHVDSSEHCRVRLATAVGLARRFKAQLAGIYVMPAFEISPFLADQFPRANQDDVDARAAMGRDAAKEVFDAYTSKAGLATEWIEERGDATELVAKYARHRDLTVVGQTAPEVESMGVEPTLPEKVALSTGRPVLIVPYAGEFETIGERVLVAWNESPQSARAVADALPILVGAKQVTILQIGAEEAGSPDDGGIGAHLRRHGVKVEAERIEAKDIEVGELLLSRAADDAADLIVMGIYGHSRMRELVLGGASRQVLQHMTVPVLMSH